MVKNKPRFDLFAILEWTAAIAFVCALCAGAGGKSAWTADFTSLPADDSQLQAWLESNGHRNVLISRERNSVTLVSHSGVFSGIRRAFNVPKPPWQNLGYGKLLGMRGSMQWTMFSGSPYLWLAGLGVLIALGLIRRRYIKPIESTARLRRNQE
jgi:hypothetical protein